MSLIVLVSMACSLPVAMVAMAGDEKGNLGMIRKQFTALLAIMNCLLLIAWGYLDPPLMRDPFWGILGRIYVVFLVDFVFRWYFEMENFYREVIRSWYLKDLLTLLWGPKFVPRMMKGAQRRDYLDQPPYRPRQLKVPLLVISFLTMVLIGHSLLERSTFASSFDQRESEIISEPLWEEFSCLNVDRLKVSEAQARRSGNALARADREIALQFATGRYFLQRVEGKLKWIAPLQFRSFSGSMVNSTVPGFVVVDAEDPSAPAKLQTEDAAGKKYSFVYRPDAHFNNQLKRHIWLSGYREDRVAGVHLELDDQGIPHWIVSMTRPSLDGSEENTRKVLVVDPMTGHIAPYSMENIPSWVDQVVLRLTRYRP